MWSLGSPKRGACDLQALLQLIYPNQCSGCDEIVQLDQSLCPTCWIDTHFISGCRCRQCGLDLPNGDDDTDVLCDDCMADPKPWSAGTAAMMYNGGARKMVLGLKHADRHDLVRPLSRWMADALAPICPENPVLVPIPLHWRRMMKRKYNQAALLARGIGKCGGLETCVDGLKRIRYTKALEGVTRQDRQDILCGSMIVPDKRVPSLKARH
ncbi:MAG: ComF family protein, partial [Planktomarina sp.]